MQLPKQELAHLVSKVISSIKLQMAHEEADVLPLLEKHLCAAEQRAMVWRTLRGMPLRLLERVMPWVAGMRLAQSYGPGVIATAAACSAACLLPPL